eukprot:2388656-Rhodomonas_salina.3
MRAASKLLHGILRSTARSSSQQWRRNVASCRFSTSRQPVFHDGRTPGMAAGVSTTSIPHSESDMLNDGAKAGPLGRALAEGHSSEQGPQIAANGKAKYISIFDLFSIGLGPSSSHTVGPMRASYRFLELNKDFIPNVKRVRIELFGSLALTGKGHHTNYAAILGACGFLPATIDIDRARKIYSDICATKKLHLMGEADFGSSVVIPFDPAADVIFHNDKTLPEHPNGMLITLSALQDIPRELSVDYVPPNSSEEAIVDFYASKVARDASLDPSQIRRREYYSVGGGFILDEDAIRHVDDPSPAVPVPSVPYAFDTFEDLASICKRDGLTIAEVMMANELAAPDVASVEDVEDRILEIWD